MIDPFDQRPDYSLDRFITDMLALGPISYLYKKIITKYPANNSSFLKDGYDWAENRTQFLRDINLRLKRKEKAQVARYDRWFDEVQRTCEAMSVGRISRIRARWARIPVGIRELVEEELQEILGDAAFVGDNIAHNTMGESVDVAISKAEGNSSIAKMVEQAINRGQRAKQFLSEKYPGLMWDDSHGLAGPVAVLGGVDVRTKGRFHIVGSKILGTRSRFMEQFADDFQQANLFTRYSELLADVQKIFDGNTKYIGEERVPGFGKVMMGSEGDVLAFFEQNDVEGAIKGSMKMATDDFVIRDGVKGVSLVPGHLPMDAQYAVKTLVDEAIGSGGRVSLSSAVSHTTGQLQGVYINISVGGKTASLKLPFDSIKGAISTWDAVSRRNEYTISPISISDSTGRLTATKGPAALARLYKKTISRIIGALERGEVSEAQSLANRAFRDAWSEGVLFEGRFGDALPTYVDKLARVGLGLEGGLAPAYVKHTLESLRNIQAGRGELHIDIETTGTGENAKMWEIAIVKKVSGKTNEVLEVLLDPGDVWSTPDDLKRFQVETQNINQSLFRRMKSSNNKQALQRVANFLNRNSDLPIAGFYNRIADIGWLKKGFAEYGIKVDSLEGRVLDLYEVWRAVAGPSVAGSMSQNDVMEYLFPDAGPEAHRALSDAIDSSKISGGIRKHFGDDIRRQIELLVSGRGGRGYIEAEKRTSRFRDYLILLAEQGRYGEFSNTALSGESIASGKTSQFGVEALEVFAANLAYAKGLHAKMNQISLIMSDDPKRSTHAGYGVVTINTLIVAKSHAMSSSAAYGGLAQNPHQVFFGMRDQTPLPFKTTSNVFLLRPGTEHPLVREGTGLVRKDYLAKIGGVPSSGSMVISIPKRGMRSDNVVEMVGKRLRGKAYNFLRSMVHVQQNLASKKYLKDNLIESDVLMAEVGGTSYDYKGPGKAFITDMIIPNPNAVRGESIDVVIKFAKSTELVGSHKVVSDRSGLYKATVVETTALPTWIDHVFDGSGSKTHPGAINAAVLSEALWRLTRNDAANNINTRIRRNEAASQHVRERINLLKAMTGVEWAADIDKRVFIEAGFDNATIEYMQQGRGMGIAIMPSLTPGAARGALQNAEMVDIIKSVYKFMGQGVDIRDGDNKILVDSKGEITSRGFMEARLIQQNRSISGVNLDSFNFAALVDKIPGLDVSKLREMNLLNRIMKVAGMRWFDLKELGDGLLFHEMASGYGTGPSPQAIYKTTRWDSISFASGIKIGPDARQKIKHLAGVRRTVDGQSSVNHRAMKRALFLIDDMIEENLWKRAATSGEFKAMDDFLEIFNTETRSQQGIKEVMFNREKKKWSVIGTEAFLSLDELMDGHRELRSGVGGFRLRLAKEAQMIKAIYHDGTPGETVIDKAEIFVPEHGSGIRGGFNYAGEGPDIELSKYGGPKEMSISLRNMLETIEAGNEGAVSEAIQRYQRTAQVAMSFKNGLLRRAKTSYLRGSIQANLEFGIMEMLGQDDAFSGQSLIEWVSKQKPGEALISEDSARGIIGDELFNKYAADYKKGTSNASKSELFEMFGFSFRNPIYSSGAVTFHRARVIAGASLNWVIAMNWLSFHMLKGDTDGDFLQMVFPSGRKGGNRWPGLSPIMKAGHKSMLEGGGYFKAGEEAFAIKGGQPIIPTSGDSFLTAIYADDAGRESFLINMKDKHSTGPWDKMGMGEARKYLVDATGLDVRHITLKQGMARRLTSRDALRRIIGFGIITMEGANFNAKHSGSMLETSTQQQLDNMVHAVVNKSASKLVTGEGYGFATRISNLADMHLDVVEVNSLTTKLGETFIQNPISGKHGYVPILGEAKEALRTIYLESSRRKLMGEVQWEGHKARYDEIMATTEEDSKIRIKQMQELDILVNGLKFEQMDIDSIQKLYNIHGARFANAFNDRYKTIHAVRPTDLNEQLLSIGGVGPVLEELEDISAYTRYRQKEGIVISEGKFKKAMMPYHAKSLSMAMADNVGESHAGFRAGIKMAGALALAYVGINLFRKDQVEGILGGMAGGGGERYDRDRGQSELPRGTSLSVPLATWAKPVRLQMASPQRYYNNVRSMEVGPPDMMPSVWYPNTSLLRAPMVSQIYMDRSRVTSDAVSARAYLGN